MLPGGNRLQEIKENTTTLEVRFGHQWCLPAPGLVERPVIMRPRFEVFQARLWKDFRWLDPLDSDRLPGSREAKITGLRVINRVRVNFHRAALS